MAGVLTRSKSLRSGCLQGGRAGLGPALSWQEAAGELGYLELNLPQFAVGQGESETLH